MAWGFVLVTVAVRTCVEVDQVGFTAAFNTSVGATVTVVLLETGPNGANPPLYAAVRTTSVAAETPLPCTAKLAEVCPAATLAVAGIFAAEELLVKASVTPPTGAGWLSETVAVVTTPGPTIV